MYGYHLHNYLYARELCAKEPEVRQEDTFDSSSKHGKPAEANDGAKNGHLNVEQLEITGIDYLQKLVFGQLLELKLHRTLHVLIHLFICSRPLTALSFRAL